MQNPQCKIQRDGHNDEGEESCGIPLFESAREMGTSEFHREPWMEGAIRAESRSLDG